MEIFHNLNQEETRNNYLSTLTDLQSKFIEDSEFHKDFLKSDVLETMDMVGYELVEKTQPKWKSKYPLTSTLTIPIILEVEEETKEKHFPKNVHNNGWYYLGGIEEEVSKVLDNNRDFIDGLITNFILRQIPPTSRYAKSEGYSIGQLKYNRTINKVVKEYRNKGVDGKLVFLFDSIARTMLVVDGHNKQALTVKGVYNEKLSLIARTDEDNGYKGLSYRYIGQPYFYDSATIEGLPLIGKEKGKIVAEKKSDKYGMVVYPMKAFRLTCGVEVTIKGADEFGNSKYMIKILKSIEELSPYYTSIQFKEDTKLLKDMVIEVAYQIGLHYSEESIKLVKGYKRGLFS